MEIVIPVWLLICIIFGIIGFGLAIWQMFFNVDFLGVNQLVGCLWGLVTIIAILVVLVIKGCNGWHNQEGTLNDSSVHRSTARQ